MQRREQTRPFQVTEDRKTRLKPGRNMDAENGVNHQTKGSPVWDQEMGQQEASEHLSLPANSPPEAGLQRRQNEMHRKLQSFGRTQLRARWALGDPACTQPSQPPVGRPRAPRAQGPLGPTRLPAKGRSSPDPISWKGRGNQLTAQPLTGGPRGTSSTRHLLPRGTTTRGHRLYSLRSANDRSKGENLNHLLHHRAKVCLTPKGTDERQA